MVDREAFELRLVLLVFAGHDRVRPQAGLLVTL